MFPLTFEMKQNWVMYIFKFSLIKEKYGKIKLLSFNQRKIN